MIALIYVFASALTLFILTPTSLGSHLSECNDLRQWFGWLIGSCPNNADPPIFITSALLLDQIVGVNNESKLIWSRDGGFYDKCSWSGQTFDDNTTIMHNECSFESRNKTAVASRIELADHIDNYNGFLISNFTKTPIVPTASSQVKVPDFFDYVFYLDRIGCAAPWQRLEFRAPVNCQPVEYFTDTRFNDTGIEDRAWSVYQNDGYEMSLWSTNDCSGEPLIKIGANVTYATCQVLPSRVNSLTLRPLFNADYDVSLATKKPSFN